MAGLAAVNQVGETLVAMLRARRDLLSAEGRLGPVPPALDITHASLSRLAVQPEPTAGCTLSCYRIMMSDHPVQRGTSPDPAAATTLAVDIHYLLAAWAPNPSDEQAIISWIMLELLAHPVLDASVLPNDGSWTRDEFVNIVPDSLTNDEMFRLWQGLQHKYRLSATFKARVVRIGFGPTADFRPVVASRFGFADTDALLTEDA